jgi:competence protein ComEC
VTRLVGSPAGRWVAAATGGFAASCGAGYALGAPLGVGSCALLVGLILTVICVVVRRSHARFAMVAVAVAVSLTGVWRGAAAVEVPGKGTLDGHLGSGPVALVATVRTATSGGGSDAIVDASHLTAADADSSVSGGLLVTGTNLPAVAPGDRVQVDASALRAPSRQPGPQSEATLERQGVVAVAVASQMSVLQHGGPSIPRAVAAIQARLVAAVDGVLPQPAAALLLGIAFGIHQPLAPDIRAPLQQAGLIHIVVVSGLKVVMLLGLITALGRALAWSPRRTVVVAALLVMLYVLASGAGPAAIRSALMAGAALLARTGGRRVDPLPALTLVAALMLGIDPRLVLDPGFQLSFLGTTGILLLAEPISARIPGPRLLVEPFAVTLAAQAATVPVMAGTFGVISIVGPVANALVLPLLPAIIVVGGGGAIFSAALPVVGWLPLHLAGVVISGIVLVARGLTALPGSSFQVGSWPASWSIAELSGLIVVAALAAATRLRSTEVLRDPAGAPIVRSSRSSSCLPGRRRTWAAGAGVAGLLAAALTGAVASRPDGELHATVLDVGSGPAVLVQTADGSLALIDGGASPARLQQALGRVLPPLAHRLGLVVLTGGNKAAAAGLTGLPGSYDVGLVLVRAGLAPGASKVVDALQAAGADVLDPAGKAWTWGGAAWRCLDFSAMSGSPMCALLVADPSGRLLVLGDAGTADQEELCATYASSLAADVVVTPPGGAVSPLLLSVVRAGALAVPSAKGDHVAPAPSGVRFDETGANGDLSFVGGKNGLHEVT